MQHDIKDTPITDLDQLLEPFHDALTPRSRWRIGTEAEKFGVTLAGEPIPYEGPRGVKSVLAELVDRHGWHEEHEYAGGEVIALRRGDASITLEPGGQLELSGAPLSTMHQTCAEIRGHMAELRDISDEMGIVWLGLGFQPFARRDELPSVPKLRYSVMREYLPTRGSRALDMMLRTATVQANMDYDTEEDAMRKLRVSLMISPIVTAMFANGPFLEGKRSGFVSERAATWLDMDPDRSGLLPFAWQEAATFRDYVEWALDVPMFLVKRGARVVRNTGQPFRAFLKDGFEGERATTVDWATHLQTLFPEVRLKKTLEVRQADGQPTDRVCSLPALWKGLLYEEGALSKLESLVSGLSHDEVAASRQDVATRALRAKLAGRDVGEWAADVLSISEGGLERLAHLDRQGRDERVHLEKLRRILDTGNSPAEALLEQIDLEQPLVPQLLVKARI